MKTKTAKDDIMATKKNGNGIITLSKVYDIIVQNESKNDVQHSEIKTEIQKNRTEVVEKMGDIKERLVKIESQPAHENFQRSFCPNTKDIAELREVGSKSLKEYTLMHQSEHKAIGEQLEKIKDLLKTYTEQFEIKQKALVDVYEKRLDARDSTTRKLFWGTLIAILVFAIPIIADVLLTYVFS